MTLEEIKAAVEAGKRVFLDGGSHEVVKDVVGQWLIVESQHRGCGYCIALTRRDGVTLNDAPENFYIGQ